MTAITIYAYVPGDFGQSLPDDPVAAAQTAASLSVTLSRTAEPVQLALEEDRLVRPVRLGAVELNAGEALHPLWVLVDAAKGARITAYGLPAKGGAASQPLVLTARLPLSPGQSYQLSLPVAETASGGGFIGGFAAGTRILSETGSRPIQDIAPGDKVWTDAGGFQPVLWHGVQSLPARGVAAPVRLRRGVLGLAEDLRIAGTQAIRIDTASGPVLVPAAALETAGRATRDYGGSCEWHQLLLPDHAILLVHGLACESLWSPAFLGSGKPADWPASHRPPAAPCHPRLTETAAAPLLG